MAYLSTAKGLITFTNELSAPEGALEVANNVVIDEPNVIEPRRGFSNYGSTMNRIILTDHGARAKQLMIYKGRLLRHYDTTIQYDNGTGTFTSFDGNFNQIDLNTRIKYVEANGNFYFTTSDGIKKLPALVAADLATAKIIAAGGLAGLNVEASVVDSLAWLQPNFQTAYRVVWGTKDINSNLILGTPSARTVITNTTGNTTNVSLSIQVPAGATTDYFVQVYRTAQVDSTIDPTIGDVAGDEMNLVDERPYDGSPIFIIKDETPEILRGQGTFLYTNPVSGSGILQANAKPPLANDLALFRNSLFFGNTKTTHKYSVNLLTAGSTDITLIGNSFYVWNNSVVRQYKFVSSASALTAYGADIHVTLSASPSQNIDVTARALVKMINEDVTSAVDAFYQSDDTSLPGLILLENKVQNDVTFYVGVDSAIIKNAFNPQMPIFNPPTTSSISTEKSDNEKCPNRVYYSKTQQLEAVPTVNYLDVGPKDKAILRVIALRDSLFILKEDGVYLLTGNSATGPTGSDFSVRLLDNSVEILSPDSCEILNNTIYALSSQGIVSITETGVQVISRNIENLVKEVIKQTVNYKPLSFGISSNIDRSYLLWCPQKPTDTAATQVLRYNTFTQTWTRWTISATCGIIDYTDNKIYLGRSSDNVILQERRNLDRTDYSDDQFTVNMLATNAIQGNDILVNSVYNIAIGDVILQNQYITIPFYNSLLKKLDMDFGLTYKDYYSTLQISPGQNLQQALQALVNKIASEPTIGTFVAPIFSAGFSAQQTELNLVLNQLNSTVVNTAFKTYRYSSGSVFWETVVNSTNTFTNRITAEYEIPLLYGAQDPLIYFKGINTEVRWVTQHFGAPEQLKQIVDATVMFNQNNFYSAQLGFSSDLSQNFEDSTFYGQGTGSWGMEPWGEFSWGGLGNDTPFRTLLPMNKQRCRHIVVRMLHKNARESFRLTGISFNPRVVSTRAYR